MTLGYPADTNDMILGWKCHKVQKHIEGDCEYELYGMFISV